VMEIFRSKTVGTDKNSVKVGLGDKVGDIISSNRTTVKNLCLRRSEERNVGGKLVGNLRRDGLTSTNG